MDENIFLWDTQEWRIGCVSIGKTYNAPARGRILSGHWSKGNGSVSG